MKSDSLRLFLAAVADDPALQAQCRAAQDLAQLVQLAQAAGFAITPRKLQLWSHNETFSASWWPWAHLGPGARAAFFRGHS